MRGGEAIAQHCPVAEVPAVGTRISYELQRTAIQGYWAEYMRWRSDSGDRELLRKWLAALDGMTGWLWHVAMGPLVEFLNCEGKSRATVITGGLLGLLPLYAAWVEDKLSRGGRRYAVDSVAFNFAPNAKALGKAQGIAREINCDELLAVAEPMPVRANPLPNSRFEIEDAIAKFPRHRILRNLSACESGVRGITLPDEAVSLPSALLQAGFAGIVGSLWSVADSSTALLMQKFYHHWREDDLEPAVALNEAQRWLRDNTSRVKVDYGNRNLTVVPHTVASESEGFGHPFWWAPFYFTGV